jgi:hypothetical protein
MTEQASVFNLEGKLAQLQELWDSAAVAGTVPEGDYEGEVVDFDFFESKADPPELFLKTELAIRLPREYDGVQLEVINSLSGTPERVSYAKELLGKLGVDVDNLSMGAMIEELRRVIGTGVSMRVTKNTRNGKTYQNVYVNDFLFAPGEQLPHQAAQSDAPPDMEGLPVANGNPTPVDPDLGF